MHEEEQYNEMLPQLSPKDLAGSVGFGEKQVGKVSNQEICRLKMPLSNRKNQRTDPQYRCRDIISGEMPFILERPRWWHLILFEVVFLLIFILALSCSFSRCWNQDMVVKELSRTMQPINGRHIGKDLFAPEQTFN